MIMAKNSNNNYVNIEDIEARNNNEYYDIEKIVSKQGNLLYNKYREIEGTLPINFKGKGKDLADYRIYGQTVDGESVGDKTENLWNVEVVDNYSSYSNGKIDQYVGRCTNIKPIVVDGSSYILSYSAPSNASCIVMIKNSGELISRVFKSGSIIMIDTSGGNELYITWIINDTTSITSDMIQDIMLNIGSTPLPYEPYGYKMPVTVEGKNLLRSVASSQATDGGTTFTRNDDGSISVNADGTSSSLCIYRMGCVLDAGDYILTGRPTDKSVNGVRQDIYWAGVDAIESGSELNFTIDADHTRVTVRIIVSKNTVVDNVTFYPMIRKADIEDSAYEPYHDPINTNIYLPEQIKMVGDEAEYIDYAEQKQHRVRKNLLQNTATSQTKNGVTFTVNADKSITCNGTTTNTIYFAVKDNVVLESGTYVLTGCPLDGGQNTFKLYAQTAGGAIFYVDEGAGTIINYKSKITILITILSGYTCNNLTFYPMIRKADIEDDTYEPYIENTDLDVTLPALPTLKGTNVLSVGTEVQPSSVYLKGKLKRTIYGWHVDPDISDSSNAITYLKDAIGMIPASMGSSTFNYGSWQNAFFMPKPCMLKSNGKVDYYLDPNDYTKKLDGTASDISNPNYDGNAMMQWPKIWFKYVKGVKEGQGYFYVANYKADGNYHCWCNYDSENNEIDHFYTAIYNGTSFMDYKASKTYVVNDFAVYDNKLYKCNTAITTAQAFDSAKWNVVSNTAPAINKMRSLSGIRLTNNNGNAQTDTTTEVTRATANNTTSAAEWYIETFSDRLLINGLLVLMGKSLNTQAVFGRGLDTGGQSAKEAYVTGTLNNKGLFWGVTENGNSGVKVFGMENFWGCCQHRTAGLITNNHAVKLKLTYGTKDGSTVIGYNQTGNGYIDNGTAPYSSGYVQKMSYNKYGFMPAVFTGGSQSTTYYADYHQNAYYTGTIYALFGGNSNNDLAVGAFNLNLSNGPGNANWHIAVSLSCKPLLN